MESSKRNRMLTVIIMAGLSVLIIVSVISGIVLNDYSYGVAEANPELEHLRIPVLVIALCLIAVFIICLILAEILLVRIIRDSIFTKSSVSILKVISWLFIAGVIPLAVLYVLTALNVEDSVTQIYVILFGIVYLTAGLIFRLWAGLIRDASRFKEEVDLTV